MCGITGFISNRGCEAGELQAQVGRMASQLVHRGPDDGGIWVDPHMGIALGFRRLAIVDLSAAGHQPMLSACGRFVIIFNGEVYNAPSLRPELEHRGHRFRGHSDTEIMLAAVVEWGLEASVQRFVGMFAFALWDRQELLLHLVRDRLGIKPLYYGWSGATFLFGSELKALRAHPQFVPEIDRDSVALQMRYGYIPQPKSIYKGIQKLSPGSILTIRCASLRPESLHPHVYWSARDVAERGAENPICCTEQEAAEQLDELLRNSVRLRMIADVPLGAFLSGGIDSSIIVALMQAQSARPVKTFTIGFRENHYDEAVYAKKVAAHLGTEHTELYLTPEEALAVIPRLPSLYDEPFSDSSQIPTYLVSTLARKQVTVSLSGDGGDELFAGYNRYFLARAIWRNVGRIPPRFRRMLARCITAVEADTYSRLLGGLESLVSAHGRVGPVGDKLYKFSELLSFGSFPDLYRFLLSHWKQPEQLVSGAKEPVTAFDGQVPRREFSSVLQTMMYLDLVTYLPDDILTKVDRASMGVSLEARVPLLDHRVVEFASQVPLSMKVCRGQGKWLLRQVLSRYLPEHLIERPKMGFGVPIDAWLRGPLREWAEDLLDKNRLARQGYFRPEAIRRCWEEHLSGRRNWHYCLWDVLMFQAWQDSHCVQQGDTHSQLACSSHVH